MTLRFFSCLTCDAPEAWQATLSEPASMIMKGALWFICFEAALLRTLVLEVFIIFYAE
jgi:hypothetical protein